MRTEHGFVSLPQYLQILNIIPCNTVDQACQTCGRPREFDMLAVDTHQIFTELNAYKPEII